MEPHTGKLVCFGFILQAILAVMNSGCQTKKK